MNEDNIDIRALVGAIRAKRNKRLAAWWRSARQSGPRGVVISHNFETM